MGKKIRIENGEKTFSLISGFGMHAGKTEQLYVTKENQNIV